MRPPADRLAARKALWCRVLEHYGLEPWRLTPAQMRHLVLHPRDKQGRVKAPEPEPEAEMGVEAHVAAFRAAAADTNRRRPGSVTPEQVEERVRLIRAAHARKEARRGTDR